uniref:uroporphyrinogen-III C-methyltransferase n=1 Tax=Timspurckia oligopyrenoides TaxID=708627 RepID=A0A7S1ESL7_9RHOD
MDKTGFVGVNWNGFHVNSHINRNYDGKRKTVCRNRHLLMCNSNWNQVNNKQSAFNSSSLVNKELIIAEARRLGDQLLLKKRAEQIEKRSLNEAATVYLIGTGPGDPELLTLKAVRILQSANVVLYDRLVSPEILEFVNTGARMIYVGKQAGFHTRSQDEIHDLMLQFAAEPDVISIVRLKGGDPYIFGRGGEEAEYLRAAGVRVTAVPGITSASGIGSSLGIPLTHRNVATSCRFITGHLQDSSASPDAIVAAQLGESNCETSLLNCKETLVVYMGLGSAGLLAESLMKRGLEGNTPVAAVERGTTLDQRAVFCTLNELGDRINQAELKSPTLLIVGGVVALSPAWNRRAETVLNADDLQNCMDLRYTTLDELAKVEQNYVLE